MDREKATLSLEKDSPSKWKKRSIAISLTLLFHLVVLGWLPNWIPAGRPPERRIIQQVNPQELEQIRRQWRDRQRAEQLLLNKDTSTPTEEEAPEDARYLSDRNRRVEKEQRARESQVMPKAGGPQNQAKSSQKSKTSKIPGGLGNLGVPLELDSKGSPQSTSSSAKSPGADQSILDPTLPEGTENILNTKKSIYYSFYARLYEAIAPLWESQVRQELSQREVNSREYVTVLTVTLDRNGNLTDIQRTQSSGITALDQAAETAWKRIQRFPNPPQGLIDATGTVTLQWSFTVVTSGSGLNLNYTPPRLPR